MENVAGVAEKAVRVPKAKVEVTNDRLVFTFASGDIRTLDVALLTKEIRERAMVHGIEQKFRDSYAGAKSADEAVGLFDKVYDHVFADGTPTWNAGRESNGEPTEDSLDLLAAAVTAAYTTAKKDQPFADAKAFLGGLSKEDRAKFRAKPSVQAELLEAKLAKAKAKVSLGGDLD